MGSKLWRFAGETNSTKGVKSLFPTFLSKILEAYILCFNQNHDLKPFYVLCIQTRNGISFSHWLGDNFLVYRKWEISARVGVRGLLWKSEPLTNAIWHAWKSEGLFLSSAAITIIIWGHSSDNQISVRLYLPYACTIASMVFPHWGQ